MAALLQFRVLVFANIILLFCLLLYSVKRDIQLEKLYCSDLRNRVVGARLQKDGIAPYFYKWKEQDGMRYFDGLNKNSLHLSNITASPAFHDLLMPVSDLPQRTISLIWFWLQYLMLALMIFLFIRLGKNNFQRISILNLAVLFTYTEAWKAHITAGQIYFFIAFSGSFFLYPFN